MDDKNYFEYTSPRTGETRRDPICANSYDKESLKYITLLFVNMLISDESEEYLHGVMKKPVKVVNEGKTVCEWKPKHHIWIDYV